MEKFLEDLNNEIIKEFDHLSIDEWILISSPITPCNLDDKIELLEKHSKNKRLLDIVYKVRGKYKVNNCTYSSMQNILDYINLSGTLEDVVIENDLNHMLRRISCDTTKLDDFYEKNKDKEATTALVKKYIQILEGCIIDLEKHKL